MTKTKIELGVYNHPCNDHADWLYQDIERQEGMDVDIVCDAKSLPMIETGSMDEVYASHIAEHFYFEELPDVLKEWVRILKPGGKLTIVIPDFLVIWDLMSNFKLQDQMKERFGIADITEWATKLTSNWPTPPHAHRNHYPWYKYVQILRSLDCKVDWERRVAWQVPEAVIVATKL